MEGEGAEFDATRPGAIAAEAEAEESAGLVGVAAGGRVEPAAVEVAGKVVVGLGSTRVGFGFEER